MGSLHVSQMFVLSLNVAMKPGMQVIGQAAIGRPVGIEYSWQVLSSGTHAVPGSHLPPQGRVARHSPWKHDWPSGHWPSEPQGE